MTLFPGCVLMLCMGTTLHFSCYFLSQKMNLEFSKCKFVRSKIVAQVKRIFNSYLRKKFAFL
jgi:hypothetical protein